MFFRVYFGLIKKNREKHRSSSRKTEKWKSKEAEKRSKEEMQRNRENTEKQKSKETGKHKKKTQRKNNSTK